VSSKKADKPDEDSMSEEYYAAEFAKLDEKIATTPVQATPDNSIKEVRVQFRGATFADNQAVELRIGDKVIAYIAGADLDLLSASLPRLGENGNTVVTWGYLPPDKEEV
jgi:hypothetical protein